MSWVYLILAIIFETLGTTALKMSNGFSVLLPSVMTTIAYILCFLFLSFALKTIDVSVAYAIWGAFGILLISAIGMIFFHESVSFIKITSILLIVLGTIGLKLAQ
ncbi:MAG: multidrug efflux SMR transporter [Candidatus Gastranaerophilales bacterium]|nr:multidrug efflux SMR transporter [Candidatus Gastranaerophilales bacterium]